MTFGVRVRCACPRRWGRSFSELDACVLDHVPDLGAGENTPKRGHGPDLEIIVTDHQTLLRRLVRDVSAAGAMLAESRRHDEDG